MDDGCYEYIRLIQFGAFPESPDSYGVMTSVWGLYRKVEFSYENYILKRKTLSQLVREMSDDMTMRLPNNYYNADFDGDQILHYRRFSSIPFYY